MTHFRKAPARPSGPCPAPFTAFDLFAAVRETRNVPLRPYRSAAPTTAACAFNALQKPAEVHSWLEGINRIATDRISRETS